MDDDLFGRLIRTFGLPVAGWAAFCAIIVHWWKSRNERLRDISADTAADFKRIRDERDHALEEAEKLRIMLTECERLSIERLGRAITAEATLQGYGDAIQRAQTLLSAERLIEHKRPEGGSK